ncbi:MAG TPA: PPC domain-containing protein, partial [Blastocatellia bacterium]|nr:PPC domain-containing protein [Blastocatellia bacterium]
FARIHPENAHRSDSKDRQRARIRAESVSAFARSPQAAAAPTIESFATGGGDVSEIEPNDRVAQGVSLPVNIFGEISFNGDIDYFAFVALEGQQITVEAFAARLRDSTLIADIALFDASGNLLASDTGGENDDALIRYVSPREQVLIVGIADADDLGGASFDYLLNITRGLDLDEVEPNDRTAQGLTGVPITIFGDIDRRSDVDFYSFMGTAGQTLIVDADAEVLGSRLDAEINLLDPDTGVEYFYSDQYDGDDPRFNIVLPHTGRYVIGVGAFNSNSRGFYRLNISLVSSSGGPIITGITRLSKKFIEVTGSGFTNGSLVEVNADARNTTFIKSGTLRAKVKSRVGDVVTVSNPPDDRRSNPLLVQ